LSLISLRIRLTSLSAEEEKALLAAQDKERTEKAEKKEKQKSEEEEQNTEEAKDVQEGK
jgi:hypothetical protein